MKTIMDLRQEGRLVNEYENGINAPVRGNIVRNTSETFLAFGDKNGDKCIAFGMAYAIGAKALEGYYSFNKTLCYFIWDLELEKPMVIPVYDFNNGYDIEVLYGTNFKGKMEYLKNKFPNNIFEQKLVGNLESGLIKKGYDINSFYSNCYLIDFDANKDTGVISPKSNTVNNAYAEPNNPDSRIAVNGAEKHFTAKYSKCRVSRFATPGLFETIINCIECNGEYTIRTEKRKQGNSSIVKDFVMFEKISGPKAPTTTNEKVEEEAPLIEKPVEKVIEKVVEPVNTIDIKDLESIVNKMVEARLSEANVEYAEKVKALEDKVDNLTQANDHLSKRVTVVMSENARLNEEVEQLKEALKGANEKATTLNEEVVALSTELTTVKEKLDKTVKSIPGVKGENTKNRNALEKLENGTSISIMDLIERVSILELKSKEEIVEPKENITIEPIEEPVVEEIVEEKESDNEPEPVIENNVSNEEESNIVNEENNEGVLKDVEMEDNPF